MIILDACNAEKNPETMMAWFWSQSILTIILAVQRLYRYCYIDALLGH